MNKPALAKHVARSMNMGEHAGLIAVEAFMLEVRRALQNGEEVTLRGFGTFSLKRRKGKVVRCGLNLSRPMNIPERVVPHFKPSDKFSDQVPKRFIARPFTSAEMGEGLPDIHRSKFPIEPSTEF